MSLLHPALCLSFLILAACEPAAPDAAPPAAPGDDASDDEPDRRAPLRFSPTLSVTGGEQGPWLRPGQALTASFEPWPEGYPERSLELWVEVRGRTDGAPPLSLDGWNHPLQREGRWLRAQVEGPAPEGAWSLTLATPDDGPELAVRWLEVGSDGRSQSVIGGASEVRDRVDLLAAGALRRADFEGPRASWPIAGLAAVPEPGVASAPLGALEGLGSPAIAERFPCPRCSPLRGLGDGQPLAEHRARCTRRSRVGLGWYCHRERRLWLASSDGSDPSQLVHRYTLDLDPDRGRPGGLWIYPGDRGQLPLGKAARQLDTPWMTLTVRGLAFQAGDGALEVAVEGTGGVIFSEALTAAALEEGLQRTLPRPEGPLAVTLRSPGGAPVHYLRTLRLVAAEDPALAGVVSPAP